MIIVMLMLLLPLNDHFDVELLHQDGIYNL